MDVQLTDALDCLKAVTRALAAHVLSESFRHSIPPPNYCPCWTNEIARAHELLRRAGVNPHE